MTVFVVVVVVKTRVLTVRVGVGAVMVVVVFALPEYTVTGVGVLVLSDRKIDTGNRAYMVLVMYASFVISSVKAGAVYVTVTEATFEASVVEVHASATGQNILL